MVLRISLSFNGKVQNCDKSLWSSAWKARRIFTHWKMYESMICCRLQEVCQIEECVAQKSDFLLLFVGIFMYPEKPVLFLRFVKE